jgi:hypothetical protein
VVYRRAIALIIPTRSSSQPSSFTQHQANAIFSRHRLSSLSLFVTHSLTHSLTHPTHFLMIVSAELFVGNANRCTLHHLACETHMREFREGRACVAALRSCSEDAMKVIACILAFELDNSRANAVARMPSINPARAWLLITYGPSALRLSPGCKSFPTG